MAGEVLVAGGFLVAVAPVDFEAETPSPVAPMLLPGGSRPASPVPEVGLADELALRDDCGWVWVGSVVLLDRFAVVGPLLEISTAIIAMTPTAAAPMPAISRLRDWGRRGSTIRSASI